MATARKLDTPVFVPSAKPGKELILVAGVMVLTLLTLGADFILIGNGSSKVGEKTVKKSVAKETLHKIPQHICAALRDSQSSESCS